MHDVARQVEFRLLSSEADGDERIRGSRRVLSDLEPGGHHPVRGCFRRLPSSARGTHLMTSGDLPRKAQLRLPSIRYMWGPLFRILRHEPHRQAPHVGRGLPAQYATVRNRFSETAARLIIVPTVKSLSRQLAADRWAVLGISTTTVEITRSCRRFVPAASGGGGFRSDRMRGVPKSKAQGCSAPRSHCP